MKQNKIAELETKLSSLSLRLEHLERAISECEDDIEKLFEMLYSIYKDGFYYKEPEDDF